jgi:hypothetical protein
MSRGGIQELREMQMIANSLTDKVYKGYPKTKEEWIQTLEAWWKPELVDIINSNLPDLVSSSEIFLIKKDYVQIYLSINIIYQNILRLNIKKIH